MLAGTIVHRFNSAANFSFLGLINNRCRPRLLEGKVNLWWRIAPSKFVGPLVTKRSWKFTEPDSSSRPILTTRAMAQTSEMDVPLIVVYITVPDKEAATKLAVGLVENKLAACVNQVPGVVSTYMWEGKLETDEELLLIIKTRASLLDALTTHVKGNHPYKVPEVIALPILGGSDSYIKWVAENTKE